MSSAAYDGSGLRASATFTPAGQSASTQNYVWDTTSSVPQLLMDSASAYIYAGPGAPVEQVGLAAGTVTYLVTDTLGSVRGTVSSSGALTGTTSYDAYGNPQTAGGLTATTPFGYAGGYTDPDGLIYLIHRYYDPATGQFTSADPDAATTGEPYAYAGGDPVDATDPTGLCAESWCPPPPAHGSNPTPSHYGPGTSTTIGALDKVVVKPKPKPRPEPVARKPAKAKTSLARAVSLGAGCSGTLLKLGACASERGAAGTTAQQVKQSAIGATLILLGAIPIADILDALAGGAEANEGIYIVSSAGKDYVGQSGNISVRLVQHVASGKSLRLKWTQQNVSKFSAARRHVRSLSSCKLMNWAALGAVTYGT
jgi:RHS repeat-associated protein